MPRASAEDAAATARRILAVASEMLAAEGFGATSLEGVADASGVTRGAVYHHFRSKRGLFLAVAESAQQQVAEAVVAAARSAEDDPAAQLRAGSHAFLDAITAAPVVRILLVDAPAVIGWSQWRTLDADASQVHLRDALSAVGVPADLLEATTVQLSGAMNECALWLAQRPDDAAAREAAHRSLERLLAAVAP